MDIAALLKMGDYHWYGCEGHRDVRRAADLYAQAAMKHSPQVGTLNCYVRVELLVIAP